MGYTWLKANRVVHACWCGINIFGRPFLLGLIVICTSINTYCQDLFPNKIFELVKPERVSNWYNHTGDEERNALSTILKDTSFNSLCYEETDTVRSLEGYRYIDLNNDGNKEVVFSGFCQPYAHTIVFENSNGKWLAAFEKAGRIVDFEQTENGIILYVFLEACCCLEYNTVNKVSFIKKSIHTNEIFTFHAEVIPSSKPLQAKELVCKNIKLRYQTIINNKPTPWECNEEDIREGNIVEKFDEAALYLIDTVKLNNKEWLLVCICKNVNTASLGSQKTWYMGWVSVNELKSSNKNIKLQ